MIYKNEMTCLPFSYSIKTTIIIVLIKSLRIQKKKNNNSIKLNWAHAPTACLHDDDQHQILLFAMITNHHNHSRSSLCFFLFLFLFLSHFVCVCVLCGCVSECAYVWRSYLPVVISTNKLYSLLRLVLPFI